MFYYKKDKCLQQDLPASPHLERFRDLIIVSLTQNTPTFLKPVDKAPCPSQLQTVSLVACKPQLVRMVLEVSQTSKDQIIPVGARERCQSLFSSRSPTLHVVIVDTPASINSQLLKLEGQFVLFLYSVRIEIKREFPFKLYLRNVNQPGI